MDSLGFTISLKSLAHAAALQQIEAALYPRGVLGWLRRRLWWRLFPRRQRLLEYALRRLTCLAQQELLSTVLELAVDQDKTISELQATYKCQRAGVLNRDFDRALGSLAQEYGLEFYGSGIDMASGERDLAFDRRTEEG